MARLFQRRYDRLESRQKNVAPVERAPRNTAVIQASEGRQRNTREFKSIDTAAAAQRHSNERDEPKAASSTLCRVLPH